MPNLTTLGLFFIAALTLIATPGPNTLYVTARSFEGNKKAGAVSALGIGVGSLVHTSAAALGLSALLMSSAVAYAVVKYLGAAYLIYLGIRTLLDKERIESPRALKPASMVSIFGQAVLTDVLNPKAALFFLAFLPQFADPARGAVAWQIAILGVLYSVTATTWYALVGVLAGSVSRWLRVRPSFSRLQQWFTGSVLIALGIRVALPEKA